MSRRVSVRLPLLSLVLLLSACGGGGRGGGTARGPRGGGRGPPPPPPPAPPPPPPPPTGANASLIGPLTSETFVNDAAKGTGTYPKDSSAPTVQAATAALSVVYDATTGRYTLTEGGRSQSFAAADVTAEDASSKTYTRNNGNVTDTLLLTKPGTSGRLTYQYVGSGFWQNTVDGSSSVDAKLVAFTYGAATPASAVPTTGTAGYAVDLVGSSGRTDYAGSGNLLVDFASATFNTNIAVDEIMDGGSVSPFKLKFTGNGTIATGLLTGNFHLDSFEQFDGSLNGRFYGPAADEVGLSFAGNGDDGRTGIVGTIMGRKDAAALLNTDLLSMSKDEVFTFPAVSGSFRQDNLGNSSGGTIDFAGAGSLDHKAPRASWTISENGGSPSSTFTTAANGIVSTDARFWRYEKPGETLLIYSAANLNPELKLTYTSFAEWTRTTDVAGQPGVQQIAYLMMPFGVKAYAVPTTGTALYNGIFSGHSYNMERQHRELGGSASFNVAFGTGRVDGIIIPMVIGGNWLSNVSFSGNLDSQSRFIAPVIGGGTVYGALFGPQGVELGASVHGATATGFNSTWLINGVAVAKQN